MNSDARLLPLDEVRVGMIVSKDVLVTHSGLILRQGAVVTETILLSLQRSGMETLDIVLEKATDIEREADREVERECQRQRLAKLFRRCSDGPAGKLLWQYMTQYRLGGRHA
ncbi:MAG: hypothetical protein HHJ12_10185 [Glaciimonas sp.]|nr:hypothetical protein [Glaciimonas sp.]